jgi:hypothetical protein
MFGCFDDGVGSPADGEAGGAGLAGYVGEIEIKSADSAGNGRNQRRN